MINNNLIFCTYFDKNYLVKGLALYFSLIKHNPGINFWVLPMDLYTAQILKKLKLKNLFVINKKDFEDEELLKAKKNRSRVEYLWTCTPSLPLYILRKNKKVSKVIYLDADLFFYSSIEPALKELGNGSIYSVEHRFPSGQKGRELTLGRFNVAFQIFTRGEESIKCLKRWRKQCLNWCYWKKEGKKMGDQVYLNEWPNLYKNLVISQNLGIDAAPWNISQYKITKRNKNIFINNDRLICYHFHQFEILENNKFNYAYGYNLSREVMDFIYKPYVDQIIENIKILEKRDPSFKIYKSEIKLEQRIKGFLAKVIGPLYWRLKDVLEQEK